MKMLMLALLSLGLTACRSPGGGASEWPWPFPMYVVNHSDSIVTVRWTFGTKEERSEVGAGEEAKLLPPFLTDSDQPIKKVIAMESNGSQFDFAAFDQSMIPRLRFVVKDAETIEVYERSAPNAPIMILKAEHKK